MTRTRLPNNAAQGPGLVCTFCGDGIFVGNGRACYVCMATSGMPKIGTDDHSHRANLVFLAEGMKKRLQRVLDRLAKTCGDQVTGYDSKHVQGRASINDRMQVLLEKPTQAQLLDEIDRAGADDTVFLRQVRDRLMKREVAARSYSTPEQPPAPPAPSVPPTDAQISKTLNAIDKFLTRPAWADHCQKCAGHGKIDQGPQFLHCDVCAGLGYVSRFPHSPAVHANRPVIHDDPEEEAPDCVRTGNASICEVCNREHVMHQLHQFGTGAVPLLLRRICDDPATGRARWRKL